MKSKRGKQYSRVIRGAYHLPLRSYQPGKVPYTLMTQGQLAVNLADRRLWIATANRIVEITDLQQLFDHWHRVVQEYEAMHRVVH